MVEERHATLRTTRSLLCHLHKNRVSVAADTPARILFVSGFAVDLRARDLAWEFEKYGRLVRCDIPAMKSTHNSPYAFIEFVDDRDAEDAFYEMHGQWIGSHRVTVAWSNKGPDYRNWRNEPAHGNNSAIPSPLNRESRDRLNGRSRPGVSVRASPLKRDHDHDRSYRSSHRRGRSRSRSPIREVTHEPESLDQVRSPSQTRAGPRRGSPGGSRDRYEDSPEKSRGMGTSNSNASIAALKAAVRREYGEKAQPAGDPYAD